MRHDWKVGDEAIIIDDRYGSDKYTLVTITKVTPSGQVIASNGEKFNASGDLHGSGADRFTKVTIYPADDGLRKSAAQYFLAREKGNKVKFIKDRLHAVDTAMLDVIYNMVKEKYP